MPKLFITLIFLFLYGNAIFATDEINIAASSKILTSSQISESQDDTLERDAQFISMDEFGTDLTSSLPFSISSSSERYVEIWLDTEIINKVDPLSKHVQNGLFVFGSVSATARGSVYFILGYKLSENYLVTSLSSPWNHLISVLYAGASSVPMTILGTASSQKFSRYLITPTSPNLLNILKEESDTERALKVTRDGMLVISAACSSSILTYIAYDNFYPLIGWFWLVPGFPTFYVRTLIDYYAMKTLGGAAYEKIILDPKNKELYEIQPNSRGANIYEIKEILNKSREFVSSLNFRQAKILEDIVQTPTENLSNKIRAIVEPENFIEDDVNIKKSSRLRDIIGYVGGGVAVYGMYLYYNGTKAAYGFTQPLFNLTETEADITATSLAIFSLATASSLSAIAAHSSAQKFYDVIAFGLRSSYKWISSHFCDTLPEPPVVSSREDTELKMKRAGVASLAFLLACCDAGTLYELATQQSLNLDDFSNVLALVSSSVALFSMSFWAVDEGLMTYVRGGDPKATILDLIDQINQTLSSMSDSSLEALRQIIGKGGEKLPLNLIGATVGKD